QRREKSDVDPKPTPGGRVQVLRKAFPVPREAPGEDIVRNGLDVDEVPGRDLTLGGLARRQADAAIAHEHGGHAVPRRAGDERVPADLRVVVRMRIDEDRRNNKVRRNADFLGAAGNLAMCGDLLYSYCDDRPMT